MYVPSIHRVVDNILSISRVIMNRSREHTRTTVSPRSVPLQLPYLSFFPSTRTAASIPATHRTPLCTAAGSTNTHSIHPA